MKHLALLSILLACDSAPVTLREGSTGAEQPPDLSACACDPGAAEPCKPGGREGDRAGVLPGLPVLLAGRSARPRLPVTTMKRISLTFAILSVLACDPSEQAELRDANTKGVYIETFNGAAIDRAAVLAVIQECGKQLDPPQRLTLEWEDGPGVGTGIRNVIHLRGTMLADFELLECYTAVFTANGGVKIPE